MAEVTKPIALDESFNTTESTPRNTADVLAEGLDAIANAIPAKSLNDLSDTDITTPQANQVLAYDGDKWVNSNKDYYTKSEIDTKLNYFINEKAVGVWIDNKTIYRCVFTGFNMSTSANTWAETTVSASNLSTLISGRIIDSSGQSFECSVGWSNNKVALNMPLARSNLTTLILEYTKA